MCLWLFTTAVHNIAQNSSDNLSCYSPDNHHCSDVVYHKSYSWTQLNVTQKVLKSSDIISKVTRITEYMFRIHTCISAILLACDPFVRMNRCAIAMLFVRVSGTGVHCDHTVHFSVDQSLWMDSPMFWAPWHQSMSTCSQPSFSSSTGKRGRVWMCNQCKKLYANNDE